MLSIILLILKIIGIILLVILGLVLLILFVPICYKGDVHYSDDGLFTHAGVHWLFFPVRFRFSYEDGELKTVLRIFGFNILREKKNKKQEYEAPVAEVSYENELELQERYKNEDDSVLINLVDGESDFSEKEMLDPKFTSVEYPDIDVPDMKDIDTGIKESRWSKIKNKFKRKKKKEELKKKIPLSRKIKAASIRTRSKTLDIIAKSVQAVEGAMKKLKVLYEQIKKYVNFIRSQTTRRAFKKLVNLVVKIIKHIIPRKIHGKVEFGFEEPHLTGQALGGVAVAYDMFGIDPENIEVIPYFDREMIDARLEYRGRIFLIVLLSYGLKFILDLDTRKTIKTIKLLNK